MPITPWLLALAFVIAAIPTFTMHTSLRLAVRASGTVQQQAKETARRAWWVVAGLTCLIALLSLRSFLHSFTTYAWGDVFPILALAGLIGVRLWDSKETESLTYLASAGYIAGMLGSAMFAAAF